MSLEQNKTLVRKFIEDVFGTGDTSQLNAYLSPDFVEHESLPVEGESTFDGLAKSLDMLHTGIPDLKITILDIIAEGDKVAARLKWDGTNQGELMGMPATGKTLSIDVFDMFRVQDGKITDHWGLMDMMNMMTQLGAIPGPQ